MTATILHAESRFTERMHRNGRTALVRALRDSVIRDCEDAALAARMRREREMEGEDE